MIEIWSNSSVASTFPPISRRQYFMRRRSIYSISSCKTFTQAPKRELQRLGYSYLSVCYQALNDTVVHHGVNFRIWKQPWLSDFNNFLYTITRSQAYVSNANINTFIRFR
ncbi:hypothetical protein MPSEU_000466200 [Mayamaea pseudoterrestris]|nr:hypothetical protein MPSEU_000466200 [Mayamaea pseudoterrestris]